MRELETVQTREKLNKVFAVDEPGNGGANHIYEIDIPTKTNGLIEFSMIQFQDGARKEKDSVNGIIDSDLLEIVRDRLYGFQSGEYANEYNTYALGHLEVALMWLNRRVEDRIDRNVLGTSKK